ncbi:hypothetical protein [Agromyces subbeticus]|uniref:hypothetical protein n=1 Tax=Agromyces subbeticus TaxID=293890 RepID=UPI0003B67601|nr:hypothetical protein [Agromyces subbeticus]
MSPASWPLSLVWVPVAVFALAIVIGIVVRWIRAPKGARSRLRHALGPLMSAGEKYQELHTGQRGLQDSIIEAVQEQESQGSERGSGNGTGDGAGDGTGDGADHQSNDATATDRSR